MSTFDVSSWEKARTLGVLGSVLLVVHIIFIFIPVIGFVFATAAKLAGVLLLIASIGGFSRVYNRPAMLMYSLDAYFALIISLIVIIAGVSIGTTLSHVCQYCVQGNVTVVDCGISRSLSSLTVTGGLFLGWLHYIAFTYFIYRALSELHEASGQHLFRLAGMVLLAGGILSILGVGLLVIYASFIILLTAFTKSHPNT